MTIEFMKKRVKFIKNSWNILPSFALITTQQSNLFNQTKVGNIYQQKHKTTLPNMVSSTNSPSMTLHCSKMESLNAEIGC